MSFLIVLVTRSLSSLIGFLAHIRPPIWLNRFIIGRYVSAYKVHLSDVAAPVESFRSIGEFFVRDLHPTARPISPSTISDVLNPVDGVLRSSGQVSEDVPVLVKGNRFDWTTFLLATQLEREFRNGVFFNFYLSPRDYHHVHLPLAGKVLEYIHHPGGLLPVNDWSIKKFPNLFCFNERVVAVVEGQHFRYLMVMIGALNVGSIKLNCDPLFRRSAFAREQKTVTIQNPVYQNVAERFGTFELGSSVVCVFPAGTIREVLVKDNTAVQYGTQLALVHGH